MTRDPSRPPALAGGVLRKLDLLVIESSKNWPTSSIGGRMNRR